MVINQCTEELREAERFLFTMHFENGPDMAAIVDAFLYTLLFDEHILVLTSYSL